MAHCRDKEMGGEESFSHISNIYIYLRNISDRPFSIQETSSLLNLKSPSSAWAPDIPFLFTFHLERKGGNITQNQKWKWNTWSLKYRSLVLPMKSRFTCFKKTSLGNVLLWKLRLFLVHMPPQARQILLRQSPLLSVQQALGSISQTWLHLESPGELLQWGTTGQQCRQIESELFEVGFNVTICKTPRVTPICWLLWIY